MTGKGSIERRLRLKGNNYRKKIAPLDMFSFEQISSLKKSQNKKQKKTNEKHRSSQ